MSVEDRRVLVRYRGTGAIRSIPITSFDPALHERISGLEVKR